MNTVLSKSESSEVFGMIKIGQIIKDNLIESDNLLNHLGRNIENQVRDEIKSTKQDMNKEQNIKMNKIENKINELINKNSELKDKNKR